jgi:outer membrane protein assembly factor BamB
VFILDPSSGNTIWNITVQSVSNSPCVFASDDTMASIACMHEWDSDGKPNKEVKAYNMSNGALQWNVPVPESCSYGFLAGLEAEKAFYLLCSNSSESMTLSQLLKVGVTDGHVQWVFKQSTQELGSVFEFGAMLYVTADTGNFDPPSALGGFLHAVRPQDGKLSWTYEAGAPVAGLIEAGNGSTLIATADDGRLHAVGTSDGKQLWRIQASVPKDPQKFFPHSIFPSVSSPVLSSDSESIYLFGSDGLHAFSSTTGQKKWSDAEAWGAGNGCPINRPLLGSRAGNRDVIYSLSNDSQAHRPYPAGPDPDVLATVASSTDAERLWRSHPGFEGPCPSMWYVSNDGKSLFITAELGNFFLHALNTSNGANKWQFNCPALKESVMLV